MGSLSGIHTPVLLDRCVDLLAPALGRPGAVVLDATLGMGGHSEALLERFPEAVLVGIDRDTDALRIAGRRLARFGDRARLVHAVYDEVDRALDEAGVDRLDAALFDLGVSSLQLDRDDRGFAYSRDAPLDMRMDQSRGRTAADVVAQATEGELRRLFSDYGDEPLAGRYARRIVETRESSPIVTSAQLVAVLQAATPRAVDRGHPGKRVFQALRIEVNAELDALEDALPAALDAVAVGGRIVVMSYQSLEDRLVKRAFQAAATSTTPPGLPVELPEHAARFRLLTRGAERASEAEQARNPRSAPVRLRAAERVAAPVAAVGRRAG